MNSYERIYNLLTETDTAGYIFRKTSRGIEVRKGEGLPYVPWQPPKQAKRSSKPNKEDLARHGMVPPRVGGRTRRGSR